TPPDPRAARAKTWYRPRVLAATADTLRGSHAGVAELADAAGLGPVGPRGPWRFESSRPHHRSATSRSGEFFCECGRDDCQERLTLTLDAYVALYDSGRAILAEGHQLSRSNAP